MNSLAEKEGLKRKVQMAIWRLNRVVPGLSIDVGRRGRPWFVTRGAFLSESSDPSFFRLLSGGPLLLPYESTP